MIMFIIGILILLVALFILISYRQTTEYARIELTFIVLIVVAILFMVYPQHLSKLPTYFIKFYFGP